MKLEIELTEAEAKAFRLTKTDPKQLIKDAAKLCVDTVVQSEMQKMFQDPTVKEIPANTEQIIMNIQETDLIQEDIRSS